MAHTENPYQSPQTPTADTSPPTKPAEVGWKQIARRWEILRLPYNVIVGLAGLLALAMIPALTSREIIVGVVAYGFGANVLYLLGPITEMYLNWLVDLGEGRFVPSWIAGTVRSRFPTALLFLGGLLFSIGLTLLIGLSEAFAVALPNQ